MKVSEAREGNLGRARDAIVSQPADVPSGPSRGLPLVGAASEHGATAVNAIATMFFVVVLFDEGNRVAGR
jgi:hypothetical protein